MCLSDALADGGLVIGDVCLQLGGCAVVLSTEAVQVADFYLVFFVHSSNLCCAPRLSELLLELHPEFRLLFPHYLD